MSAPETPVAAATHPDPYPYYAGLVASRPFYRDERLGLWVASSAGAVSAVLGSDLCLVRPAAEPVPRALAGTAVARIYGQLIRMNDGRGHRALKSAVSASLSAVALREVGQGLLPTLSQGSGAGCDHSRVTDFAFRFPVQSVGSLLGVRSDRLEEMTQWAHALARCIAPAPDRAEIERGHVACGHLIELFESMATGPTGLLSALAREGKHAGQPELEPIVANAIGLLFQVHDATAGLIGNTLLALAARKELRCDLESNPLLAASLIAEVSRWDPSIQSTRRFVGRDGAVAGAELQAGEGILVLLAAANRDPAVNAHPDRLDVSRKERRTYSFGAGGHACPGQPLAEKIAELAVGKLLSSGVDLDGLAADWSYLPSLNARVPLFGRLSYLARLKQND